MIRFLWRLLTGKFSRDQEPLKFSEKLCPKKRWRDSEIWMVFWIGLIFGFGFNLASWIVSIPFEQLMMFLEWF